MTIGDRIKKIREHFEITSNEFAELTGIHPVTIRKYETNKMQPSKEHIDKMCESLRLPRMVFEGIPEQYTDLHFRGDLYQVVLSLMASGILSLSTEFSENGNIYTKPSEELADLIDFTIDGNTIPLDKIKIEFKPSNSLLLPNNDDFLPYIGFVKAINKAQRTKRWTDKGEKKEEYIARMNSYLEEEALKLMLKDHSWHQYMKSGGSYEESISELNRVLESGGNFYDYVDNMDAPEKIKKKYLLSYEKERAKEILGIPQMMPGFNPKTSDMEEVYEWHLKQEEAIKKYILSHPDDFRVKNEADFDE